MYSSPEKPAHPERVEGLGTWFDKLTTNGFIRLTMIGELEMSLS